MKNSITKNGIGLAMMLYYQLIIKSRKEIFIEERISCEEKEAWNNLIDCGLVLGKIHLGTALLKVNLEMIKEGNPYSEVISNFIFDFSNSLIERGNFDVDKYRPLFSPFEIDVLNKK